MFIVSGIFLGWGATLAPWGAPLCSRSPAESPEMISGRFVKLLGFTLKSSGSCIWCFGLLFSSLSSMRSRGLFFYWIMFLWGESMFELLGNIFQRCEFGTLHTLLCKAAKPSFLEFKRGSCLELFVDFRIPLATSAPQFQCFCLCIWEMCLFDFGASKVPG